MIMNQESLLQMKINQQKMLCNTLNESLAKCENKESIYKLQNEIVKSTDEVLSLRDKIEGGYDDVQYATYDEEKKKTSLFDKCLKKITPSKIGEKDPNLNNQTKCGVTETSANSEMPKANTKGEITNDGKKHVMVADNKFIVQFSDELGIPSEMVVSVSFENSVHKLSVYIYDFITKYDDGGIVPIIETIKNSTKAFDMNITHFDEDNNALYNEAYWGCRVSGIFRDSFDVRYGDVAKFVLEINYDGVDYGPAN